MSHPSTTLPLYFCDFGSNSALRWHVSAKWTFLLSLCASRITSFLLLPVSKSRAWIVSSFFQFFIHCCLCIRYFNRLWHRDELVHRIVMRHRSKSFACNVVVIIFRLRRFHLLPCGFMTFHYTTTNRFLESSRRQSPIVQTLSWCHRVSFVILVVRIDKVNSSHSSSFVELWFFFCSFLFFSSPSSFTNFRPNFWTYMI